MQGQFFILLARIKPVNKAVQINTFIPQRLDRKNSNVAQPVITHRAPKMRFDQFHSRKTALLLCGANR